MYYYNGKFNGKEFWVTLLELIDNDIYKLENISGTKYLIWNKKDMFSLDYLKLKTYEEKLVLFINILIYEDNKGRRIEFEELKEKVRLSPTIDKTMKDFYTILNNEIADTYGTIRNDHKYSKRFSNNYQKELYLNLIGLKNFMVEFTNTCTRPIDYINFLDKYYVLAVALDVNLKEYDYLKGVYDDDTIHTFDADDLIRRLEDGTLPR